MEYKHCKDCGAAAGDVDLYKRGHAVYCRPDYVVRFGEPDEFVDDLEYEPLDLDA